MKRIVFFTLFSVLLSLFVSSVEAARQERTLRINNRNVNELRLAYCYVVHPDDVNKIGEKAGYHVKGWVRVPSGHSVTITYPKTSFNPLFLAGVMSNGQQLVPTKTLSQQELPVHPEKDFEVLLASNGDLINATAENNGINYRVEEKDLDWFKFGKKLVRNEFVWEIAGPMPLNYDADYDMEGFIRERHGKDYALLFATNEYEHWDDLSTPIADAEAIGAELENRYGFNVDIRKNVTRNQILEALAEYKQKRYATGDQLLVYFAGHGAFDEALQDGHIAGTASEHPKTDRHFSTYLSFNRLRNALDNFPCERIMLMLDVCHGGTFDRNNALSLEEPKTTPSIQMRGLIRWRNLEDTLKVQTRWYLSSGEEETVDGLVHSPFAASLLTVLRDGAGIDGVLTIPEIERLLPGKLQAELDKLRQLHPGAEIKQIPASGPFGSGKAADKAFVFIGKDFVPSQR